MNGGIGYVLKKFPVLSETFILTEILALEARGIPVHIFSLERPNDPRFHEDLPKLKASVSYVPDLLEPEQLWKHNHRAIRTFGRKYFREIAYAFARGTPTLAWRVMQAAYVANETRRFKLQHLHAHFATRPTSVAFLASRLTGVPYSFTAHAMDIYKHHLRVDALARKIEHARFVVTVSDYNKQFLEQRAPIAADRVRRIYNGIDLQRFAPNGGPPEQPFRILCVARFVEKKGHRVLIEACRILRDRGHAFECLLVGKGNLRSEIYEQIKVHQLKKHVRLVGPQTQLEVRDHFQHAHVCALPSLIAADGNREGLPVSVVEALACGVPVVTTPLTGLPEVVQDGENGLLVPPGDGTALADALERLMNDRALLDRLSANARASVVEKFDIERTSTLLHQLMTGTTA